MKRLKAAAAKAAAGAAAAKDKVRSAKAQLKQARKLLKTEKKAAKQARKKLDAAAAMTPVRAAKPAAVAKPLAAPQPSFPDTKFYLLEAPPYYAVRDIPHSFGSIETEDAKVDGIELELAAPARGVLHVVRDRLEFPVQRRQQGAHFCELAFVAAGEDDFFFHVVDASAAR